MSTLAFHLEQNVGMVENFKILSAHRFLLRFWCLLLRLCVNKREGSHIVWWPATKSRVFIFLDKILFKCITKSGFGWLERKTSRVFSVTFLRFAWLLRTFRLKSERIKNIKITTSSEKWALNVHHQSCFKAR